MMRPYFGKSERSKDQVNQCTYTNLPRTIFSSLSILFLLLSDNAMSIVILKCQKIK